MNERIFELAEQANLKIRYRIDPNSFKQIDDPNGEHIRVEFDKEKFAELIVCECARVVDSKTDAFGYGVAELWCTGQDILEHFGVDE